MKSNELNDSGDQQIFSNTTVLNYCLDQNNMPFAFMLNGLPIGDHLKPGITGLPEHIYQGYTLSRSSNEVENFYKATGYSEIIRKIRLNGVSYTLLIFRNSLPPGGKALSLITIRDITASMQFAEGEDLSEIFPGLIAANISDVFYFMNQSGKLIFVSQAIEKLSGYQAEDFMKSPLTTYISPETKVPIEGYLSGIFSLNDGMLPVDLQKEPKLFEVQIINSQQDPVWAEISVAPYIDHNQMIRGVYGIIRNISEQKQIQEEIQTSLQFEIERSSLKSKYISSVSHEFRTPLSIIYSNLQLLESHLPELDSETISDSFNLSKLAVKSLLRVLDKITIIDAAGKGKLEFKPVLVEFPVLIHDLVKELNDMEIVPGRILVHADPGIEKVYLDDYLFHHIFSNLLQNALIFSDKKQSVEFSVNRYDQDFLNLEVKDNGIGIPQEDMALLYEPFFRAHNSRFSKGSGLGLAVVHECLKLHKGIITIDSHLGEGTTVKVRLPVTNYSTE